MKNHLFSPEKRPVGRSCRHRRDYTTASAGLGVFLLCCLAVAATAMEMPQPRQAANPAAVASASGVSTNSLAIVSPHPYPFPIRGIVYEDANGNGRRDAGETLLSSIPVSDGHDIVVTGADGAYRLPNAEKSAKTVFLCVPSGYEKRTDFYRVLLGKREEATFDFGLRRSSPGAEEKFTFAQITDIHVTAEEHREPLIEALAEVAESRPRPDFILATGDLVGKGDRADWMEFYRQATQQSDLPVFHLAGNHDRCEGADRALAYNHFLGPDYYSFNHGAFHFLIRSNTIENPAETKWVEENLRRLTAGKRVLIFQHYPPNAETSARYREQGVAAVFSGHWHSHKIHRDGETLLVNTPTFLMGGIDLSPSGFRLVHVEEDQFTLDFRPNGIREFAHVVWPARGAAIPFGQPLFLRVNAYDTRVPLTAIRAKLQGKTAGREIALSKQSPFTWGAELDERALPPGDYTLTLTISPAFSHAPQPVPFVITTGEKESGAHPPPAPMEEWTSYQGGAEHPGAASASLALAPRLIWATPLGGSIDFASPVVARGKVFIGIKDRAGESASRVAALDAQSGKPKWLARAGSPVNHGVAYIQEKIITQEMGGKVRALDPQTGRDVWTYECGDAISRWLYSAPSPIEEDILVGSARWLARLNPADGSQRWRNTDGVDWISCYCTPASARGIIIMAGNWLTLTGKGKGIYAVNAADGKTLWAGDEPGLHGAPTIVGNIVYYNNIRGDFRMAELDTGKVLWTYPMNPGGGNHWSPVTPVARGHRVITGTADGRMMALDTETRTRVWEFQSGPSLLRMSAYQRDYRALLSSPVLSGGLVYFGSGDGRLYALDFQTGEKKWEFDVGVPVLSTPAIVGSWLYVGACDGTVYAFHAASPETSER